VIDMTLPRFFVRDMLKKLSTANGDHIDGEHWPKSLLISGTVSLDSLLHLGIQSLSSVLFILFC